MHLPSRLLVVCLAGALIGCAEHAPPKVSAAPVPPPLPLAPFPGPPIQATQTLIDPVTAAIGRAESEFDLGQRELQASHVVAAREHFDAAVDALLDFTGGVRSDVRLNAEFEQLLDRISSLDVLALREGDGFTESQSEPAALDELLSAAMFARPAPLATTADTVAADLARTPHDFDIPVNDRVLSFVELFQGRLHDFMEAGLERGLRYLPMIQATFREQGLPLDLAYVPLVESAFKPNALSRASARGMWQFMAE